MSTLEWTEKSTEEKTGVDHLGMRVAGEKAYEKHIDFITTVTWRPRYFSFFCWLSLQAFREANGKDGVVDCRVNIKKYNKIIKRTEYAMVAATLCIDPSAGRVAGRTKVLEALNAIQDNDKSKLTLAGDHLRLRNGGYGIYAGIMRNLGFVSGTEGIDIPASNSIGRELAAAFAKSISKKFSDIIISSEEISLDTLSEIGKRSSLSKLNEQANHMPEAKEERDLIRNAVFDWNNYNNGFGSSARRILSVGLILELRQIFPEEKPTLNFFRECIIFDEVKVSDNIVKFKTPTIYDQARTEWRIYHVHAYIVYSLEALLSAALFHAKELQQSYGNISYSGLLDILIKIVPEGIKQSTVSNMDEINGWWNLTLTELEDILNSLVRKGRRYDVGEPDFFTTMEKQAAQDHIINFEGFIHDAFLMFLLAITRLRLLIARDGQEAWVGSNDPRRLPPETLIAHFNKAISSDLTVMEYCKLVVDELVIRQHRKNALRKLFAQPGKDTSKLIIEGPDIIPIGTHKPGTSNPRYDNTLIFLQDLGYLTASELPVLTSDGEDFLKLIQQSG